MTCLEFEDWLDRCLLASADGPAAPAARQHARQCPACRQREHDWRWLHDQAWAQSAPLPRADLADRVLTQLTAPTVASAPRPRRLGWSMVFTTSVLGGMIWLGQHRPAVDVPLPPAGPGPITQMMQQAVALPHLDILSTPTLPTEVADASAPAPWLQPALETSTDALRQAGDELKERLAPVPRSAVGAWAFLWQGWPVEVEKPAI